MAYYTKEEIQKYINENNKKIIESGLLAITPIEEPISQLANEEDLVRFWFLEYDNISNLKIVMKGKVFIRIVYNLYTDDMFAIDTYKSSQGGISIEEAISQRKRKQKETEKNIPKKDQEKLYKAFEEKIKKTKKL